MDNASSGWRKPRGDDADLLKERGDLTSRCLNALWSRNRLGYVREIAFITEVRRYTRRVNRGETEQHAHLKALALAWAQANGLAICATEVRVPRSGYRADVAAIGRRAGRHRGGFAGQGVRTAVFECKQARADLLKDAHAEVGSRTRLEELTRRRKELEAMFAVHRPDLRRGEALWPEYDAWDFSTLEHRAYRGVLNELVAAQRHVLRGTKFSKMFRYRCADFLYLVVEPNIFAEAEVPAGWGLLVRIPGQTEAGDALRLARPPATLDPTDAQRAALLESIALAATRAVNRTAGCTRASTPYSPATDVRCTSEGT